MSMTGWEVTYYGGHEKKMEKATGSQNKNFPSPKSYYTRMQQTSRRIPHM